MSQDPKWHQSEITPGLFIARAWDAKAARFLREYGITSIVSLEGKVPLVNGGDDFEMLPHPEWDYPENRELVPGDRHLFVHVSRYRYINVLPILSGVCDFIDKQLGCDSPSLSAGASAPDEEGQLDDDQVSVASADSDASTEVYAFEAFCNSWRELKYKQRNPDASEEKKEEEAEHVAHADNGAAKDGAPKPDADIPQTIRSGLVPRAASKIRDQKYLDGRAWRIARDNAAAKRYKDREERRRVKEEATRAAMGLSPAPEVKVQSGNIPRSRSWIGSTTAAPVHILCSTTRALVLFVSVIFLIVFTPMTFCF